MALAISLVGSSQFDSSATAAYLSAILATLATVGRIGRYRRSEAIVRQRYGASSRRREREREREHNNEPLLFYFSFCLFLFCNRNRNCAKLKLNPIRTKVSFPSSPAPNGRLFATAHCCGLSSYVPSAGAHLSTSGPPHGCAFRRCTSRHRFGSARLGSVVQMEPRSADIRLNTHKRPLLSCPSWPLPCAAFFIKRPHRPRRLPMSPRTKATRKESRPTTGPN